MMVLGKVSLEHHYLERRNAKQADAVYCRYSNIKEMIQRKNESTTSHNNHVKGGSEQTICTLPQLTMFHELTPRDAALQAHLGFTLYYLPITLT